MSISSSKDILVFALAGREYGIFASSVREVTRAVTITQLPNTPTLLEGIIDFHGTIVPVVNLRATLGLGDKPLMPSDDLILGTVDERLVAMRCDGVVGLVAAEEECLEDFAGLVPAGSPVTCLLRTPTGPVLVCDLSLLPGRNEP